MKRHGHAVIACTKYSN